MVGQFSSCPVPVPRGHVLWVVGEGMVQASAEQPAVSQGHDHSAPSAVVTPSVWGRLSCRNLCLLLGFFHVRLQRVFWGLLSTGEMLGTWKYLKYNKVTGYRKCMQRRGVCTLF